MRSSLPPKAPIRAHGFFLFFLFCMGRPYRESVSKFALLLCTYCTPFVRVGLISSVLQVFVTQASGLALTALVTASTDPDGPQVYVDNVDGSSSLFVTVNLTMFILVTGWERDSFLLLCFLLFFVLFFPARGRRLFE